MILRLISFFGLCLAPALILNAAPTNLEYVQGITWGWVGSRGEYESPEAAESMRELAATGAKWACIAFSTTMESPNDPDFTWADDQPTMVSDDEVRHAIDLARRNNLKVILKPVINCKDGTWRAWIKFYRPVTAAERAQGVAGELDPWGDKPVMRDGEVKDLAKWDRWWNHYQNFLVHYAEIAQEKNVEMFCLGCEMSSTEEFVDQWRKAIGEVRAIYDGALTYDVNHGREMDVKWWDAIDAIGVSGYYPVPPPEGSSLEDAVEQTTSQDEIAAQLAKVKHHLAEVSKTWHRPIIMIETGVTNVRGCARYPWSHPGEHPNSPLDDAEQANYYRAFFETFSQDAPWFMGYAWWDWPARLYPREKAGENRGFCFYGKQAEDVVKQWYAKPVPTVRVE